ncbi:MAG: permease [Spirochaetia bacterium]
MIDWIRLSAPLFFAAFSGLAFETLPFLAIGSLISALIHVFVPGALLQKFFPKNRMISIIAGIFLGVLLPVCECGTVPVARSLKEKGLPLSTAAAFLLAAPLVNPITIVSTIVAFQGYSQPVFLIRAGLGVSAAFLIALVIEMASVATTPLSSPVESEKDACVDCEENTKRKVSLRQKIVEVLEHTSHDFLDTGRFLVIGIFTASLVRVLVPMSSLAQTLSRSTAAATGIGMAMAYVLSLCSSADAFVARSLLSSLPFAATLGFLLLGPMIDIKNTILLSRFIPSRKLGVLVALIAIVIFTLVMIAAPVVGGAA